MKKYSRAIITILILGTFLTFPKLFFSEVQAAQFFDCTCDSAGQSPNFTCRKSQYTDSTERKDACPATQVCIATDGGMDSSGSSICDNLEQSNNKYCNVGCKNKTDVPKEQLTPISCSCTNPYKADGTETRTDFNGTNGFTCTYPDVTTLHSENITKYDSWAGKTSVSIFCSNGAPACVNGADKSMKMTNGLGGSVKVEGEGVDGGAFDAIILNRVTKGVSCEDPKLAKTNVPVNCHCDQPGVTGDKKNGLWCDGQKGTYRIYCTHENEACVQGSDKSMTLNEATVEVEGRNADYDDNFKGKTGKGVACEAPVKPSLPPLPPVAPPPCADGELKNGVCSAFMTAFGKVNTDASSLILKIFAMLLAISGGLAVLLIMRAGYILMTSAGNGERVKKGREQLVAAIVGLLFIIFSFVILEVIGVQILRLPEFEGFEVAPLGTCEVGGNQCSSGYTCNYVGSQGQCVKDTTP